MSGNGLLQGKNAIVYGGAGGIGTGVARALAREGAKVFLAGRTQKTLQSVAEEINAAGGSASVAEVDATDEQAVDAHVRAVVAEAGSLDVSINLISHGDVMGVPLVDMSTEDFSRSLTTGVVSNYITGRAAARQMAGQGSGAILTLTNGAATSVHPMMGSVGVTAAAIENFTRYLAAEAGPAGVRVLGIRIAAVPETWPGYTPPDFDKVMGEGFTEAPEATPESAPEEQGGFDMGAVVQQMAEQTMLHRLATLSQVADVAAFLVSDRAGAMTSTITNITCGMVHD